MWCQTIRFPDCVSAPMTYLHTYSIPLDTGHIYTTVAMNKETYSDVVTDWSGESMISVCHLILMWSTLQATKHQAWKPRWQKHMSSANQVRSKSCGDAAHDKAKTCNHGSGTWSRLLYAHGVSYQPQHEVQVYTCHLYSLFDGIVLCKYRLALSPWLRPKILMI